MGNYTLKDNSGNFIPVQVAELQSPDKANVCLHITGTFSAGLYTITASTAVRDSNGQQLSGYPDNTASFSGTGTSPESFTDGPVIGDPMNETSTNFSMLIKYRGRFYIEPADANNAVYRLKLDESDPEMVSFRFHTELAKKNKLIPSDKAFPAMTVFNNKLFVIRNVDDFSNRPQLGKYDGDSLRVYRTKNDN